MLPVHLRGVETKSARGSEKWVLANLLSLLHPSINKQRSLGDNALTTLPAGIFAGLALLESL